MNVIIVGGGQAGSHIGHLLLHHNINVKFIESQELRCEKLTSEFSTAAVILGSGTNPDTLEAAGVEEADVILAVTGSDEVNLVASTIAKFEFAIPRVVARVNNPNNSWLYNAEMGVDVSINQSDLLAQMVVSEMDMDHISTLLKLNRGNLSIAKVNVNANSKAIAHSIKELNIPAKCVLIAILRDEERVIIPRGDTVIEANDYILLLSDESTKEELNAIFVDE
ncbi:TrkA family potassium uptake protein [Bacillus sp. DNRA2]|uniref:potassium channel family protein n=1 Tax=Bacillus sp. DNRA2 TaxID=2723053 RepID=UPI00145E3225|nr:TrkA family potassium uptake protein [Bacillus sp. DNRA2]NMD71073.1 TrkA family potassium uptake protein [Bacillus sp. DNRA2]